MRNQIKATVVGGIAGGLVVVLALLALASGPSAGRATADGAAQSAPVVMCGEMQQMMEHMDDPRACQRMHETMEPDAEKMMDQCTAMMKEMQHVMPGSGTGMMGGQNGDSMRDMMRRMMPQS